MCQIYDGAKLYNVSCDGTCDEAQKHFLETGDGFFCGCYLCDERSAEFFDQSERRDYLDKVREEAGELIRYLPIEDPMNDVQESVPAYGDALTAYLIEQTRDLTEPLTADQIEAITRGMLALLHIAYADGQLSVYDTALGEDTPTA